MTDSEFNHQRLREELAKADTTYPLLPGLVYRSHYGFVAEHGREYPPVRWHFGQAGVLIQKKCYANAIHMATAHGLKYVEGFALARTGEIIMHAWNAMRSGELVDATWANTGVAYIGVEFSAERADDATWNGDACVLNDEHRGYPIFRQRWQGEDYSRRWPYSDRLEAIERWKKTGVFTPPPSMVEWERGQQDGSRTR